MWGNVTWWISVTRYKAAFYSILPTFFGKLQI